MKILHTADWHLGLRLNKIDLLDQMVLFLDWLADIVEKENIECILHAGDIFDTKHPPQDAVDLYNKWLAKMIKLNCQVKIIAGNHDSGRFISSPKILFQNLDIRVIGHTSEKHEEEIILLHDKNGLQQAVICAIPFIRQGELAVFEAGMSSEQLAENINKAMSDKYSASHAMAREMHPGLVTIGMGHLFIQGTEASDVEHQIHVGNLGGLSLIKIDHGFDYIALGHIHRPQGLSESGHIRYAGSPVILSFSEMNDRKSVMILEIKDNNIQWEKLEVPMFRKFIRWTGSVEEIKDKIINHQKSFSLKDLIEVRVVEDSNYGSAYAQFNEFLQELDSDELIVAKKSFSTKDADVTEIAEENKYMVEDLQPKVIMQNILGFNNYEEDVKISLMEAFEKIENDVHENQ